MAMPVTDDVYRREFSKFLRAILAGSAPTDMKAAFGQYTETALSLIEAHQQGGTAAVSAVYTALAMSHPEFSLMASPSYGAASTRLGAPDVGQFTPLSAAPTLTEEILRRGCPWLADYIAFSAKWSPRGYAGFHPACGLWLLSTVAAGRVIAHFGDVRKTSVLITLTSRSSKHAKTTTARVAQQVLADAGLDWLLFQSDEASPQKFLQSMVGTLPDHYAALPDEEQRRELRSYALSGQRGWYYDEFGTLVSQVSRQNGYMAEFRGILRWMDDNKKSHTVGTLSRGNEKILNPYLSLLCNMTPADLKGSAKRGSAMWGDGFWARFAFICPPSDLPMSRARFPKGRRETPDWLITPLQDWHMRLGEPEVYPVPLLNKKGEETGEYTVQRETPLPENEIEISEAIHAAINGYGDLLDALSDSFTSDDLNSNYIRFPEKALRLAMLFASLAGVPEIGMDHWNLAVAITEQWRENLHSLIEQVNEPEPGLTEQIEGKILRLIEKRRERGELPPTARQVCQFVSGAGTEEKKRMLKAMVDVETIEEIKMGKTTYYRFPVEPEPPLDVSAEREMAPV